MLLKNLNQTDKEKFVELAYKVAYSDRVLTEAEMTELQDFRTECGVASIGNTGTVEQLMTYFADRTPQVRRIVFFGIYSILFSNDMISELDQQIIDRAKADMNLTEEEIRDLADTAQDLRKVHLRLIGIVTQ